MGVNERQNRTVLFVHIPKTAGTTLRVLFTQQYAQQPWFVVSHNIQAERARLAETPAAERSQYRMVFGHMEWGWHQLIPPGRAYAYTTMLRDPVERVLSLYSHARLSEHYLGAAIGGRDIEWFVTSGVTRTADNGMVRQLCGRDLFLQKPWRDMSVPFGSVTSLDLDAAIQHLNECALVGVSERFDAYLNAGRREFGWRAQMGLRENVSIWPRLQRRELTAAQLRAVEKATALDRVLYEHAKRIGA